MKLTKQLLKKFENPDINVRVINGSYKEAVATVTYSNRREYKIVVRRIHPLMEQYQSCRDKAKFHYPTSTNSWTVHCVPEQLSWLSEKLYELAETTDEEAATMLGQAVRAMREFQEQFYGYL